MTKQVLDDVERVLDPGPHLRQRALHRLGPIPQVFRQCLDDAALDRDVPVDIAVLKFGPLVRPGIAGIGEDSLLPTVQQGRRLVEHPPRYAPSAVYLFATASAGRLRANDAGSGGSALYGRREPSLAAVRSA